MRNRTELQKHEIVRLNSHGEYEIIDIHTGEVVVNTSNNQIPAGQYAFDYAKALAICQYVKEGKTLIQIAEMPNMPPMYVISHWQRMDRMFAEEIKLARKTRAEYHHEKVLGLAEKAARGDYTKDEVPSIKLGADLYKWSAERANPESYGSKITHEGSTEKPILMRVINTGINRAAKEAVVVEAEIKETPSEQEEEPRDSGRPSNVSIGTGITRTNRS